MLKELVALEPGKPVFREYAENELQENQIRVAVEYGSVKHGTDFQMLLGVDPMQGQRWDDEFRVFVPAPNPVDGQPFVFNVGNMWVGRITAIGKSVQGFEIGEMFSGYGALRTTHTLVPAKTWGKLSGRMTWKDAVCYDPAQFAYSGVRDGNVCIGDRVAVFGLGAIGLLAMQFAKLSGASQVIAVDPLPARRAAALACGADQVLDPLQVDAGLEIKKLAGKCGVDVAVETSGSYPALHQAIRCCGYGGTVSVVGWYKECLGGLTLGREAHMNQVNLIMSRACNSPDREHPRWSFDRVCQSCWNLLADGRLNCEPIIAPVVSFDESAKVIAEIARNPGSSIKLGVRFQPGAVRLITEPAHKPN